MNKPLAIASVILAIALLACLLPMPYGYYTLIRFATMIVMACLCYSFWQSKNTSLAVVSGALAILFQPFVKVALGRDMWNVVDVIVAVALFGLCYKYRNTKE